MTFATQTTGDIKGDRRSVKMFGAKADGVVVSDCSMTATSNTLLSASNKFRSVDVGKPITVDGAGAGGSILKTHIATFVGSGQVTLVDAAVSSVTGAVAWWGTDNAAAINAGISWLSAASNRGGGSLFFPFGVYMVSSPIILATNVSLVGEFGSSRYSISASDGTTLPLRSQIKASGDFPTNGFVVDGRGCSNLGFFFLEITGDGTTAQTQSDATVTGLGLGNANQLDADPTGSKCQMQGVSISLCKRNVWSKLQGLNTWNHCNFAAAWYISVDFEKYAGNDSTYAGCYINSNNWLLARAGDPFTDLYTGTGLRLGFGCTAQTWLGGKIEYCGTGIVQDIGSWGCHFTGIHFDANAKWHVRIRGGITPDDLTTIDEQFMNCRFNGGSYMNTTNGYAHDLSGLDGHILIEGQTTAFLPVRVGANFIGNSFKAQNYTTVGGLYEYDPNYPKWPQNNIIATRVIGSDPGLPDLRLLFVGNDVESGSIQDGTATIAGTAVTRVSGNSFDSAWVGKIFWQNLIAGRYTITAVAGASNLTISPSAGTISSAEPWYVETNRILIDPNFSAFSDIRILSNKGVPSTVRQSSVDQQDVFNLLDNVGGNVTGLDRNGNVRVRARTTSDFLVIPSDVGGTAYIGRFDSGGTSVLDADDIDLSARPDRVSFRLKGNENIQFNADGVFINREVSIGGAVIPGTALAVYGFIGIDDGTILLFPGTGDPNGSLVAPLSSLFFRKDTGDLYIKGPGTGSTGWVIVATGTNLWTSVTGGIRSNNQVGINIDPTVDLEVNTDARVHGTILNDTLTASEPVLSDASKKLVSGKIDLTNPSHITVAGIGVGWVPMSNGTEYFGYDLTTAINVLQSRVAALESTLGAGIAGPTTVDTAATPKLDITSGVVTGAHT